MSTREGIIAKKCSTEWHRPASNAACRAGTCQHTCPKDKVERCPHAWTLRYSVNGKQREQSFRDDTDIDALISLPKLPPGWEHHDLT